MCLFSGMNCTQGLFNSHQWCSSDDPINRLSDFSTVFPGNNQSLGRYGENHASTLLLIKPGTGDVACINNAASTVIVTNRDILGPQSVHSD